MGAPWSKGIGGLRQVMREPRQVCTLAIGDIPVAGDGEEQAPL
jgi:hypothetical protein